jgi:hypothetical protein
LKSIQARTSFEPKYYKNAVSKIQQEMIILFQLASLSDLTSFFSISLKDLKQYACSGNANEN